MHLTPVAHGSPSQQRPGFTLIEVMIVVVILAILASLMVFRYVETAEQAKESSAEYNLRILRQQIEIYKYQHGGLTPALVTGALPQLTSATDAAGNIGSPGPLFPFGPYMTEVPVNSVTSSAVVAALPVYPPPTTVSTDGWLYHEASGRIDAASRAP
jgi:general secretion pathway protein G